MFVVMTPHFDHCYQWTSWVFEFQFDSVFAQIHILFTLHGNTVDFKYLIDAIFVRHQTLAHWTKYLNIWKFANRHQFWHNKCQIFCTCETILRETKWERIPCIITHIYLGDANRHNIPNCVYGRNWRVVRIPYTMWRGKRNQLEPLNDIVTQPVVYLQNTQKPHGKNAICNVTGMMLANPSITVNKIENPNLTLLDGKHGNRSLLHFSLKVQLSAVDMHFKWWFAFQFACRGNGRK